MLIELTQEQAAFVRRAIEAGRFQSPEDAVRDALDSRIRMEELGKGLRKLSDMVEKLRGERDIAELADSIALAIAEFDLGTTDDPFRTFDEWNGEADRKAYADL